MDRIQVILDIGLGFFFFAIAIHVETNCVDALNEIECNLSMYIMSIAILKRKTQALENISGRGADGFSLVGGYRNQGWVGQTSLSRSIIRTPFRGDIPKGHGGTGGAYQVVTVDGTCCVNDPAIIKRPNMTTEGLILSRIDHPTSVLCGDAACAQKWVKNENPLDHSQSQHTKKIHALAVCGNDAKRVIDYPVDCKGGCKETTRIGSKVYTRSTVWKNPDAGAMDSSQYIATQYLRKQCLPTPPCKAPFPMILNRNSCLIELDTPEQAIEAGLLPQDWMNCSYTDPAYASNPY